MSTTLPFAVGEKLRELGARVRTARQRRDLTVAELAAKAGINRNTLTKLEQGSPGVSVGAWLTVLWALGLDQTLDAVAHPDTDAHGRALEASRMRRRVRKPRAVRSEYDF